MSEENLESVATTSGDVYDYLDQPEVETPAPAEEPAAEEPKPEEEPSTEDGETEEHKPWKAEKKAETPAWARKRFREYSTTVRDLKQQNVQLMESVKQMLNQSQPKAAELTRADFPDDDSYIDHKAEQKVQAEMEKYQKSNQENAQAQARAQQVQQAEDSYVNSALTDIPDYHEAIQNGDPDVSVPVKVLDHLRISPAGPYVKYKIATDEALSERLKVSTPAQKIAIITEIHDGTLEYLTKRNNQGGQPVAPAAQAATPQAVPAAAPRKPAPRGPKAPRGTTSSTNINSLSGDAYVRARNAQLNKR